MKKLILSTMLLLCASFSRADTFTNRFSLVKISTSPGDIWGTKTNANWATVDAGVAGQSLYNVFTTTQVFSGDVVFPNISPGGYMTVDSSGNLTTQAGGGGGGASSLATALGTTAGFSTLISTPTGAVILNKNQFVGQLVGSATAYYDLNQNTTYYIHNGASVQTATMNISTATIGNVTVSTLTVLSSATIANVNLTGTTLAYSSGTFLNSVAIGTTNANGQTLRVIDTGSGINTYEIPNNVTLYHNIENNTAGTSANIVNQILGAGGDSATGAKAGDGEIKTSGNLYLAVGGATAKSEIYVSSTTGVIASTMTISSATITTLNVTTCVGCSAGGSFINNTSSLQSGATFYVSSGTVNNKLNILGTLDAGLTGSNGQRMFFDSTGNTGTGLKLTQESVFYNANPIYFRNPNERTYGVVDMGTDAVFGFSVKHSSCAPTGDLSGACLPQIRWAANPAGAQQLFDWNQNLIFGASAPLTASQFVQTDASKNLISYDLLNTTQTWTAQQSWTSASPSTFTYVNASTFTLTGFTNAMLGSSPNGTMLYCSDCTVTTPATCVGVISAACVCAGSGNGAFAKRLNGSWYCN